MSSSLATLAAFAAFSAAGGAAFAVDGAPNLPMPPQKLVERLSYEDFTIAQVKGAGGGVMGAQKLDLQFEKEPRRMSAKWKATGAAGDGWNNSPRREIGAYVIQSYFLDPQDYLVPPTAVRCIPLDVYAPVEKDAAPTFHNTRCVFGELSAWLSDVVEPEHAFDRDRFVHDPAYSLRFAQLNLLHYLVDHRDSRANNFLMSKDPNDPRIYSIDNGIAFGGVLYNFFTWHFNEIRVPMPKDAIARLRKVTRADLDRLGVLGQMENDGNGVLRNVALGPNLGPDQGVRLTPWGGQFGLTREEIDAVEKRLRTLLARIDAGEIKVF